MFFENGKVCVAMRYEKGSTQRDMIVSDQFTFEGIVNGSITVKSGGDLTFIGGCTGDLTVEKGARANIDGVISGDIINNGGEVVVVSSTDGSYTNICPPPRVHPNLLFSPSNWEVFRQPKSNRRRISKRKESINQLNEFVPVEGVSARDVATAADRLKARKEAWEQSGSPSISDQELEQASQKAGQLKARLQALSDWRHCGELLTLAALHFCLLFRHWPTATALMQTIFLFAIPVLIAAVGWAKIISLFGWYFVVVIVGYTLMIGLLFYPFRDRFEKRVTELEHNRMKRMGQFRILRTEFEAVREAFSEIKRQRAIQTSYVNARTEHDRLVKEFDLERSELLNVDWRALRGIQFESFLAEAFTKLGYLVHTTKRTGDFGVDLIAIKDNSRIAIQAKGYTGSVGKESVDQVFAGQTHYNCTSCAVITNSTFTRPAYVLAKSTKCRLIDGSQITLLIMGKIYF